jgi:CRISPR/Cas system-associated endonuclease Cas3-HD
VTCWAYYPEEQGEGVPEEFARHSIGVVEYLFNDLWYITAPVIRKVSKTLGVSEGLVSDAVLLSGLLHDLGKTCSCYQEKPWEGFSGHWLLSASIVFNIIRSTGYDAFGDKKLLTGLFVLPILLHHYAQSDLLGRINKTSVVRVQVYNDCVGVLKNLVSYGLARVRSPIGRSLLNDLHADLGDGVLNALPIPGWVFNTITSKAFNHVKIASMAITGLLNEADGTVAGRNRNRGW